MDKITLSAELTKTLESANFLKVIRLWEGYADSNLDFNCPADREICDDVSHSYLRLGQHDQALIYLEARIDFMKSSLGKEDRMHDRNANWDNYCGMKGQILFERNEYLKLYKLRLIYKYYGGNEEIQLVQLFYLDSIYYEKYFKPGLYRFVYFLSIIIPCMILYRIAFPNALNSSIYYYAGIFLGILIIVLYLYSAHILKKIILQIFRVFVQTFINDRVKGPTT